MSLTRLLKRDILSTTESGAYKTRPLNIHEDPSTFVRLVLGLSSPSEAILGFDTSVQWTVKNGKRVSGSITTLNALGKRIKYQLNMAKHVIVTRVVRGRGTVCWHAKDKDGKSILLKDSWRTDGQKPEHMFLERAKGLVGVAQMIAFEDNRAETKLFRPASFDFTIAGFDNRTMCRVTMPCYGLAVHEFTSQAQAIAALRDAIQGHLTLLKVGLLHQDVSIDNILLGEDAAPAGFCGILIDLEMAVHVTGPAARIIDKHHQAGTRLYQSVSVVDARSHLPRDYIDDLESFFYVLCYLLYGFEGVNVQFPDAFGPDSVLGEWERRTPRMASYRKEIYITMEGPAYRAPPPFWSVACINLCDKYRKFLAPLIDAKGHIRRKHPSLITREELQEIYSGVDNHYADVLAMFDTALVELSKPGGSDPRPAPPAQRTPESSVNSYISTSGSSSTSPPLKRPLGHLEELDTPSAKRQRLNFNDLNAHDGSSSHSD
ncbi:hypothetical protein D9611_006046 [Ephemerocybe angulata]|uniref:Fungal-type protein kinase domain-containing protein n=1 Tax=Ephemerocybe angulata TaxID=980116 RepID=A0A8H5CH32_9AGAR|nr:hypothetical protein D9611_006046 [Tulosesus angulatus]